MMTLPEVAKILGVADLNVHFYIGNGELKAFNSSMGTRRPRWKIRQEDLDAFIASRSSGKPDAKPKRRKTEADSVPQYV
jgi:predicted site-specific integrase-resolvase